MEVGQRCCRCLGHATCGRHGAFISPRTARARLQTRYDALAADAVIRTAAVSYAADRAAALGAGAARNMMLLARRLSASATRRAPIALGDVAARANVAATLDLVALGKVFIRRLTAVTSTTALILVVALTTEALAQVRLALSGRARRAERTAGAVTADVIEVLATIRQHIPRTDATARVRRCADALWGQRCRRLL
jgi:hypothetical protein